MSARILHRPRASFRIAGAGAAVATAALLFSNPAHAEADPARRKPIYDEPEPPSPPPSNPGQSSPSSEPLLKSQISSAEVQLSGEVRKARLSLYKYTKSAEDSINSFASRFFTFENSFTSTIASLAPPRNAPERQNNSYLPNLSAVFVAALGGSILAHRRNILIRAAAPIAFGIGAGYYFVPLTTRNVGNLIWTWEEKSPAVARTHLQIRDRTIKGWNATRLHSRMAYQWVDDKVGSARKGVEGWIGRK